MPTSIESVVHENVDLSISDVTVSDVENDILRDNSEYDENLVSIEVVEAAKNNSDYAPDFITVPIVDVGNSGSEQVAESVGDMGVTLNPIDPLEPVILKGPIIFPQPVVDGEGNITSSVIPQVAIRKAWVDPPRVCVWVTDPKPVEAVIVINVSPSGSPTVNVEDSGESSGDSVDYPNDPAYPSDYYDPKVPTLLRSGLDVKSGVPTFVKESVATLPLDVLHQEGSAPDGDGGSVLRDLPGTSVVALWVQ